MAFPDLGRPADLDQRAGARHGVLGVANLKTVPVNATDASMRFVRSVKAKACLIRTCCGRLRSRLQTRIGQPF
jgi:hypothetical protein